MIIFIHINILIAISYALFFGLQKLSSILGLRSSAISKLRLAQAMLMFSLLVPFGMKLLPQERYVSTNPIQQEEQISIANFKATTTKAIQLANQSSSKIKEVSQVIHMDIFDILVIVWTIGFLGFLSILCKNYFQLRKVLLNSVSLKKKSKIKIVITDEVAIPFSVRLLKSFWVVMPTSTLNNKIDTDLVIKHEFQHHRQGDTTWALWIEVLTCLFYLNPAIYFWKNIIIELQEFSCDEALTGQKVVSSRDYGSCLLRVAETALLNRQMYAGTTSMAVVFKSSKYFKTFLLRRIEMIMEERKSKQKWISICTGLLITIMTITVAYGVEKLSRAKSREANSGNVIVDNDVQKIADDALTRALKDTKAIAGFIIVADPSTGKILAVANIDTKNPKKGHWALAELIEPASFAKTFVIAEAIEKNATNPTESHACENGAYKYKDKVFHDWKKGGWKSLTTSETLAVSSDICSIKIGEKVGEKELEKMVENFGFGQNGSAKDFPEAKVGDAPELGAYFIPRVSLGYAFRSSPIEIMQAYGAIANGGNLMKPIMGNSQKPEVIRRVLSEESAKTMRGLLQEVVSTGTAKDKASSNHYTAAGKTASARLNDYMKIDWYGGDKHANFAGFVGFAPVSNPKVQVFVGLINPNTDKTGAHGGWHAAPVFKEVAENVLTYLKVAPDKI